jgi:hypothetical protein
MYSQIAIAALSDYPPGVNKLYCVVLYCTAILRTKSAWNASTVGLSQYLPPCRLRLSDGRVFEPTAVEGAVVWVGGSRRWSMTATCNVASGLTKTPHACA